MLKDALSGCDDMQLSALYYIYRMDMNFEAVDRMEIPHK